MKSLFFKERIYALIIDLLFISILSSIIRSTADLSSFEICKIDFLNREWVLNYNLRFLISILYFLIFDILSNGISLGKKIVGLKIEKTNSVPDIQIRILRTILKSFFLFTIFIPITLIFYFMKNEVLYDRILKTDITK